MQKYLSFVNMAKNRLDFYARLSDFDWKKEL